MFFAIRIQACDKIPDYKFQKIYEEFCFIKHFLLAALTELFN